MPLKKNLLDLAQEARERGVPELDVDELIELMDQPADENERPIILDVREADEYSRGHIPGSISLPRGILERDIERKVFGGQASDQDLNRPIVCYCRSGHRSMLTGDMLRQMGFTNAQSLEGGFIAWGDSGRPVEI